jgi:hypothetical protein
VPVLLEVQVPGAHVGVQRPIRMVDVHRTGRGHVLIIDVIAVLAG